MDECCSHREHFTKKPTLVQSGTNPGCDGGEAHGIAEAGAPLWECGGGMLLGKNGARLRETWMWYSRKTGAGKLEDGSVPCIRLLVHWSCSLPTAAGFYSDWQFWWTSSRRWERLSHTDPHNNWLLVCSRPGPAKGVGEAGTGLGPRGLGGGGRSVKCGIKCGYMLHDAFSRYCLSAIGTISKLLWK